MKVARWRLTGLLPKSLSLKSALAAAGKTLAALQESLRTAPGFTGERARWAAACQALLEVECEINQLFALAYCRVAQAQASAGERSLLARAESLLVEVEGAWTRLAAGLDEQAADSELLDDPELGPQIRYLLERRSLLLGPAHEGLLGPLERDSLAGWAALYRQIRARTGPAHVQLPDRVVTLSLSELQQKCADPCEAVRRAAHQAEAEAWSANAELCCLALDNMTKARRARLDALGCNELVPTLVENRMSGRSIAALLKGIEPARAALRKYLSRKATCLGKPALDWWDLRASPFATAPRPRDWSAATEAMVAALGQADPRLGEFARHALAARWIDAASDPDKQTGGFCANFAKSRQSRIFLSFGETDEAVFALAHELGHAYHNYVLSELPPSHRHVPPVLLETASTYAEHAAADMLLDPADKAAHLERRLVSGWRFLMDAPARFEFERSLYRLERHGPLDAGRLCEIMTDRQRAAFGTPLASWHPMLWASSSLFYFPTSPFINWHYTAGFLLSTGLATARRSGDLAALLARTGTQTPAALARSVLDGDLEDAAFWSRLSAPVLEWVEAFLDLTSDRAADTGCRHAGAARTAG